MCNIRETICKYFRNTNYSMINVTWHSHTYIHKGLIGTHPNYMHPDLYIGCQYSMCPPALTTKNTPLDQLCNVLQPPVSLLHVVGTCSAQSFRNLLCERINWPVPGGKKCDTIQLLLKNSWYLMHINRTYSRLIC